MILILNKPNSSKAFLQGTAAYFNPNKIVHQIYNIAYSMQGETSSDRIKSLTLKCMFQSAAPRLLYKAVLSH